MRILVFSDSHGCLGYMERKVAELRPDKLVHLGDHDRDVEALAAEYPQIEVLTVAGNCDRASMARLQRLEEWDGVRVLLTHGHAYGVKQGLTELAREAQRLGAATALYGHTHQARLEYRGELLLLNPGAACQSCALLELHGGTLTAKLLD